MKITLNHTPDSLRFISTTEDGRILNLDASSRPDTNLPAQSPMQAVLSAVAACSSVDVVELLKKMRQPLESLEVLASGQRREEIPKKFTHIKLHFILKGHLKPKKVEKVLDMSVNKYCSVAEMLTPEVDIQYSYELINNQ